MATNPDPLVTRSLLQVFGERDPAARREAAGEVFSPDVVFRDGEDELHGVDALLTKVEGLLAGAPADWVFAAAGPAQEIADLGRASWTFGPPGAPPVVRGTDIALQTDGRIARLYTFVEASG